MKLISLMAVFCALIIPASAANHYVRSGAQGSGSGADWTNAYTDFGAGAGQVDPSAMTRGDTYFVGSGTYAGQPNFSTANSGTTQIIVKGATIADHGTATGWSNSYSVDKSEGGTQAVFTVTPNANGSIRVDSSYWDLNGNAGPAYPTAAHGNDPTYYGFNFNVTACNADFTVMVVPNVAGVLNNVFMRYLSVTTPCTPSDDHGKSAISVGCGACNITNFLISHIYTTGLEASIHGANYHDTTMEYLYFENAWSSSAHHADTLQDEEYPGGNGLTANNIVRYSVLKDCTGTGGIIGLDAPGTYTVSINGWKIYGNVFDNCGGGNGAIAIGGANAAIANTQVFNNVFVNGSGHIMNQCEGPVGCAYARGNLVENNLVWESDGAPSQSTGGAITMDHNTCASVIDSCFPGQTNGQTYADPSGTATFVNPAAHDFRLNLAPGTNCAAGAGQTCAGATLSSAVTGTTSVLTNMMGGVFGSSGAWERGALPTISGGIAGPVAPQGLAALVQ